MNRASESHVIVNAGENNVEYSSYDDLAGHLEQRCDKVGFSSILLRNDNPEF